VVSDSNYRNHFAVSGRAAAVDQNLIQQVARDYPADLMLIKLGFNDLGWFYSDDNGLINNMRNLINNARRANRNMKFVVGTVGKPSLMFKPNVHKLTLSFS
jgi:lysophospholipase L1-like esterase